MTIEPVDLPMGQIDLTTHSLTGWPDKAVCEHCGGELCLLVATYDSASYECRGRPETRPERSAYSPDRCGRITKTRREHAVASPRTRRRNDG